MKIKFLLLGTSLSFLPQLTFAQCVATQDCTTLGYTETSCNGGKGIKCPFGNSWACIQSDSECEQQFCDKYGFQYTCTGANETGGSGKSCNGKYIACTCASGYEWNDNSCQPDYAGCAVGTLFYSDNTCSNNLESGKTLLGVVIMKKTARTSGWIMTINPIQTGIAWSTETVDIPNLTNSGSYFTNTQDSCTDTDIITSYGNSYKYPAAWAAKNYSPSGTPSGKLWCLPSGGLLSKALDNSTNFAKINTGIITAGGTKIGNVSGGYEFVWSSSEAGSHIAWSLTGVYGENAPGGIGTSYKIDNDGYYSVRPVLAF